MFRVLGKRSSFQRYGVIRYFTSSESGSAETSSSKSPVIPDVKGVSERVVDVPKEPVGFKGCTKETEYKNPEYFCYHIDSYHDAFVEMEKYRLPAPSNKKIDK